MAGRYHYATPVGEGMRNLADAIGGMGRRDTEQGLMQARQHLLDEQALSEASQRMNQEAQARYHNAQAGGLELTTEGRRGAGQAFFDTSYGSSGAAGGSAGETATVAPPTDYALMPDLAGAVAGTTAREQGMGLRPAGLAGAVAPPPPVASNPGGVTPELVRQLAGNAAKAGEKVPDLLAMFVGGNIASQTRDPDRQLSSVQSGAKMPYASTIRGGQETIDQRATAAKNTAGNARYKADLDARTRLGQEDKRQSGATTRSTNRDNAKANAPAKPQKPLTEGQVVNLNNHIEKAGQEAFGSISPEQRASVVAAISQRYNDGEDLATVMHEEMQDMVGVADAEEVPFFTPGNRWGKDKPAHPEFKAPALKPGAQTKRAAPAPAGAAPAPTATAAAPAGASAPPMQAGEKGLQPGKDKRTAPSGRVLTFKGYDANGKSTWAES